MSSSRRRFLVSTIALGGASMTRRTAPALGAVSPDQVAPSQTPDTPAANATENAFTYRRNWGRWGANDQMGAVNLITAQKRAAAAALK